MRKKIWLVVAATFAAIGLVMFVGAMAAYDWDFAKLSTGKYTTNTYGISEEFSSITIKTDTADILFVPSDDETGKVVCYEEERVKHSVKVEDGVLIISVVDDREWYDHVGINFDTSKITVCIPEGKYGPLSIRLSTGNVELPQGFEFESMDISGSTGSVSSCASVSDAAKIKTSTGSIRVESISAGALELSVSTGKITVSDVTSQGNVKVKVSTGKTELTDLACENVISSGSTGDIALKNVIAMQRLFVKRSTGDVKLDRCDAAEILIETDTGDITGTLLSEKVFIVETDTGSIEVPKTVTGGRCEITTDTGDIRIDIQQ